MLGCWQREGKERKLTFATDTQRLPAGREDRHVEATGDYCCQLRRSSENPLTVVQDKQEPLRGKSAYERLEERLSCRFMNPERGGDGRNDEIGIGEGREINEDDAIDVAIAHGGRD